MALHPIDSSDEEEQRTARRLRQDRFCHQLFGESGAGQIQTNGRTFVSGALGPVLSNTISDRLIELRESAEPLVYRLTAYFMLTILDDPAMLALAFC